MRGWMWCSWTASLPARIPSAPGGARSEGSNALPSVIASDKRSNLVDGKGSSETVTMRFQNKR